ncbi:MAG: hypothetical protein A2X49_10880 [Lentisphaerae bacterium GWF2_52_8]|nr:MAG: hypothetical protein A2X49_10880 [Lentisphaerae bacterium GWF2_52_8]
MAGRFLDVVEYSFPAVLPQNAGVRILFLSDLHWAGHTGLVEELREQVCSLDPDWLIYGGDLCLYACHLDSAFSVLDSLEAKRGKIAVYGNWDKRRRRWFPFRQLAGYYKDAGFKLLVNEGFEDDGLYFYGADDFKLGHPVFPRPPEGCFSCLISHNPDAPVLLAPNETLSRTKLFLCGHTHGGQVCLPYFGAIKTSSLFWKKFEYGRFRHSVCGAEMIVSSGLGTSVCPFRLFRRPELVLVNLV